jgi:hypothetical protein
MDLMANNRGSAIELPVREQSEIFADRRRKRRARINSTHAEVRAILQSDLNASLTVRQKTSSLNPKKDK